MIKLDITLCNSCGLCEIKCPFNAIIMDNKYPSFMENCLLCGICRNICPQKAISIDIKTNYKNFNVSDYKGVCVFLQVDLNNMLRKVSFELLSKARKLADELDQKVLALCLCQKEPNNIRQLVEEVGCDELILVEHDFLHFYNNDIFTGIICDLITRFSPNIVFFPATEDGRDLAPRVASRLRLGLTADCIDFAIDKQKRLVQVRPTYGGNIMASIITPNHRPQMATARPNVFKIIPYKKETKTTVEKINYIIDENVIRVRRIGEKKKVNVFKDVSEAEIIVAGGYGVGKENFRYIHELAIKIGAAVGASRKAVDEGWAPSEIQIGQTGKNVAPKIYIACGISGALQHSIGIRNSQRIIAINNDPAAPIFSQADVSILGDVGQILRELIKLI